MLFLAHWARKLVRQETAVSFRTSWDKVCQSVEYVVQWGLIIGELGPIVAIGVDEIVAKGLHRHKHLDSVGQTGAATARAHVMDRRGADGGELGQFFTLTRRRSWPDGSSRDLSDMWQPYLRVIRERCSQYAIHILDRFRRIVAKMNAAPNDGVLPSAPAGIRTATNRS